MICNSSKNLYGIPFRLGATIGSMLLLDHYKKLVFVILLSDWHDFDCHSKLLGGLPVWCLYLFGNQFL